MGQPVAGLSLVDKSSEFRYLLPETHKVNPGSVDSSRYCVQHAVDSPRLKISSPLEETLSRKYSVITKVPGRKYAIRQKLHHFSVVMVRYIVSKGGPVGIKVGGVFVHIVWVKDFSNWSKTSDSSNIKKGRSQRFAWEMENIVSTIQKYKEAINMF